LFNILSRFFQEFFKSGLWDRKQGAHFRALVRQHPLSQWVRGVELSEPEAVGATVLSRAAAVYRRWVRFRRGRVGRRRRAIPTLGGRGALCALVRQHLRVNW
jgi:hypothetical protein